MTPTDQTRLAEIREAIEFNESIGHVDQRFLLSLLSQETKRADEAEREAEAMRGVSMNPREALQVPALMVEIAQLKKERDEAEARAWEEAAKMLCFDCQQGHKPVMWKHPEFDDADDLETYYHETGANYRMCAKLARACHAKAAAVRRGREGQDGM